jgi:hypothetical protein
LKTGWSYLSWGAKAAKKRADDAGITDKVQNARVSIRQKADENGITDAA